MRRINHGEINKSEDKFHAKTPKELKKRRRTRIESTLSVFQVIGEILHSDLLLIFLDDPPPQDRHIKHIVTKKCC
jgi:hypothetical protein